MVTIVVVVTIEVETCAHAHTPQSHFSSCAEVPSNGLMPMDMLTLCNYRWVGFEHHTWLETVEAVL